MNKKDNWVIFGESYQFNPIVLFNSSGLLNEGQFVVYKLIVSGDGMRWFG